MRAPASTARVTSSVLTMAPPVVSGSDWVTRQRFTLAHEFGHFRMGHDGVVDRQVSMSRYDHDPCEVEANAFAAEFLVPRKALLAWADERPAAAITLEDVVLLAREYGVSSQVIRYRLETCGLLPDAELARRLDGEIADGLQVEVAGRLGLGFLEDSLSDEGRLLPRIPRALRGSVFGDLLAGAIDADGAASRLGCPVERVQRMMVGLGLDVLLPAAR